MKKSRIILLVVALSAVISANLAFKVNRRGFNNLYYMTTGVFVNNGSSRILSYATLSPYRNFRTYTWQPTTSAPTWMHLYTSTTLTTTTIGGEFYYYPIVTGFSYIGNVYDDEGQ